MNSSKIYELPIFYLVQEFKVNHLKKLKFIFNCNN